MNANTPLINTTTAIATASCGIPATAANTAATHKQNGEEVRPLGEQLQERRFAIGPWQLVRPVAGTALGDFDTRQAGEQVSSRPTA